MGNIDRHKNLIVNRCPPSWAGWGWRLAGKPCTIGEDKQRGGGRCTLAPPKKENTAPRQLFFFLNAKGSGNIIQVNRLMANDWGGTKGMTVFFKPVIFL